MATASALVTLPKSLATTFLVFKSFSFISFKCKDKRHRAKRLKALRQDVAEFSKSLPATMRASDDAPRE